MNKITTYLYLILLLVFTCANVIAQDKEAEREKIKLLEEQKKMELQRATYQKFDSAVYLMERGEYASADKAFMSFLNRIKSVPSDFAYFFGKNSYFLGKYKQSIDWLNKYIQLKGTSGKFSEEAVAILKAAVQKTQEILSRDYDIDCGSAGKVNCPVCNGTTIIVKKNYLGETYKACTHCHEKGYLTCEEYNKLLKGQLHVSQ
jgi:hypothetical protein